MSGRTPVSPSPPGARTEAVYAFAMTAQVLIATVGLLLHLGLARRYGLEAYASFVVAGSISIATASIMNGLIYEPYLVFGRTDPRASAAYARWIGTWTTIGLVFISGVAACFFHLLLPATGRAWEIALAALGVGAYCTLITLANREAAIRGRYGSLLSAYGLAVIGALTVINGADFSSPVYAGFAVYAVASLPLLSLLRFEFKEIRGATRTLDVRSHTQYARWSTASSAVGVSGMQVSAGIVGAMIDPVGLARYRLALIAPAVVEQAFMAISSQLIRHTIEDRPIARFLRSRRARVLGGAACLYLLLMFAGVALGDLVLRVLVGHTVDGFATSIALVLLGGWLGLVGSLANVELKARGDSFSIWIGYAVSTSIGVSTMVAGAALAFPWAMEAGYVLAAAAFAATLELRMRRS